MLTELKTDSFNYFLFSSKSDKITEELTSLFFPECTLFESTILLVKPNYFHLYEDIKHNLAIMRYHIISEKIIALTKTYA
jgi:hypothetical protein